MTAPRQPYDPFRPTSGVGPAPLGPPGYGPPAGPATGYAPGYGSAPGGHGSPFGPGGPQLAGWWRRVGGLLIDGVILAVIDAVLRTASSTLAAAMQLGFLLYFGYLTGTTGQTPGRMVVGIRVLRERDGQFLGAGTGVARSFLHILDGLSLGLGYLWPLWDARKQTFADKAVHSVVVRT